MSIHSNRKCDVIHFFLLTHFLNPETLLSFTFQLLLVTLQPTQLWKDREHVMVLVLLKMDPTETMITWRGYFKGWCKVNSSRQSFYARTVGCTLRAEARQRVGFQEITTGDLFKHREAPGCRTVDSRHDKSFEGSPSPWWEQGGSGQNIVEGCGQNMMVGARSDTGETHHMGPVLEWFLREILPHNSSEGDEEYFIRLQ